MAFPSEMKSIGSEPIIDPAREIVDPHHHLWEGPGLFYELEDLWKDTGSGHNVTQTIFMECGASYRSDGPAHLAPVGETEFVARLAAESAKDSRKATIAALVAHADLRLPLKQLDEVLDAHIAASHGLFRGIRHAGAFDESGAPLMIPGPGPGGLYDDPDFRRGVAHLGTRGLTYDTWHYHHQNATYAELAKACPDTVFILDHFGTPLGVGDYANHREEIFAAWKDDIARIAACPNVYAKIGGLAMPDNGFGWNERETPVSSDQFVEAQARYYHHAISCFGAERCMFESNFPVDKMSIAYDVLWNGLKKIAANYSETEQVAMFSGVARKVYSIE